MAWFSCLFLGTLSAQAESVTLGAEDDWYPFSAKVNDEAKGMAVDIVRTAFEAVHINSKFIVMPYARCMAMAKAGRIHGCFNTARNKKLENDYIWHNPALFRAKINIYVAADSKETEVSLSQLEGKVVAVTNAYEYGNAFDSNTKIIRSISSQDVFGFNKLIAKRVPYAIAYEKPTQHLLAHSLKNFRDKIKPIGLVDSPELFVAFTRINPEGARFAQKLSDGLALIHKNGQYNTIAEHWRE